MEKSAIKRLEEKVINQIAAGEIIERPACVVRELMDNAIDAEATDVKVYVNYAKEIEITIKDNGKGIVAEELRLAFEQHTTSKINRISDLVSLTTLGFRGEALASIASISEIKITTAIDDSGVGSYMQLLGGKEIDFRSTAAPKGTTIVVGRLFFNAPVRKKFLKELRFEKREIKNEFIKHALSNPSLGFSLFSSYDDELKKKNVSEYIIPISYRLKERIITLFKISTEMSKDLLTIQAKDNQFLLQGYCSNQSIRIGNKKNQFLIVKKRVVRNATFLKAVEEAYKHLLPSKSYPMCFLFFEVAEDFVDFNIHPAKKEVKFKDNSSIYNFVYHQLKNKLLNKILSQQNSLELAFKKNLLPPITSQELKGKNTPTTLPAGFPKSTDQAREKADSILSKLTQISPTVSSNKIKTNIPRPTATAKTPALPTIETYKKIGVSETQSVSFASKPNMDIQILGQMHKIYILFTIDESLYITDQHAAHERINYDHIQEKILKKDFEFQLLLQPLVFEKTILEKDTLLLKEQQEKLQQFGIEAESFGKNALKVNRIPTYFKENLAEKIINNIFSSLLVNQNMQPEDFFRKTIADIACKLSIRAGETLTHKQMEDLVKELYHKNYLQSCPHGRPFVKCILGKTIDSFFDRSRHINP